MLILLMNKFECIDVNHKFQEALLLSDLHILYYITLIFVIHCPP